MQEGFNWKRAFRVIGIVILVILGVKHFDLHKKFTEKLGPMIKLFLA